MRNVVITSPVATQSGYGHHAREFITNALLPLGWIVVFGSLLWVNKANYECCFAIFYWNFLRISDNKIYLFNPG